VYKLKWVYLGRDLRRILAIGLPLVANNLSSIAINVADTRMASELGTSQLAAVAIGSGIWIALFLLGLGVIMALGPTVAQHYGAGRLEEIGHETRQSLIVGLGLSVVVFFAMRSLEPFLVHLGIDPEVSGLAQEYLSMLSWGVFAAYGYHTFKQMSEGVGRAIPIMVVMCTMLPINVALNYVLMFGKFGIEPMGAAGCGLGNCISFWIMFFILVSYALTSSHYRSFKIFRFSSWLDWSVLRRLVSLGMPIGLSLFLQSGLFTAIALLMATLGTVVVAAHQVVLSYSGLVFMVPLGLAMALTVCVGQDIGREDTKSAIRIGYTGLVACALVAGVSSVTTFFYAPIIAQLYTSDTSVIALSTHLFRLAALLQFGDGIQVAAAFALRGLKDTRVPLILNAVNYWGFGFVLAYVLGIIFGYGAIGVWLGLSLSLCTGAMLLTGRFVLLTRKMQHADDRDEDSVNVVKI
jgi:MATE family multidrug resistance protein